MATYKYDYVNGVKTELTAEQIKAYEDRDKAWEDNKSNRQIKKIRKIRNQKLFETDYLAMSDNTMSEEIKTYRQKLRDIPADYDSSKYDELLARDSDLKLTHTVWEKP